VWSDDGHGARRKRRQVEPGAIDYNR
jgi:hypothetical protein